MSTITSSDFPRQSTASSERFHGAHHSENFASEPDQARGAVGSAPAPDYSEGRIKRSILERRHPSFEEGAQRRKRTRDLLRGRDYLIGVNLRGEFITPEDTSTPGEAWDNRSFYFPQHPVESDHRYKSRLRRTPILRFVERALDSIVNRIHRDDGEIKNRDQPEFKQLVDWLPRVDKAGHSFNDFLKRLTFAAAADGVAMVLVDMPPKPPDATEKSDQDRRPILCLVNPDQLLNWEEQEDPQLGTVPGSVRIENAVKVRDKKNPLVLRDQREIKIYRRAGEQVFRDDLPPEMADMVSTDDPKDEYAWWERWVLPESNSTHYELKEAGSLWPHKEIPIAELKPTAQDVRKSKLFHGAPLFEELAEITVSLMQMASDEGDLHHYMSKIVIHAAGFEGEEKLQFSGGDVTVDGRRSTGPAITNSSCFISEEPDSILRYVEHSGQCARSIAEHRASWMDEARKLQLEPFLERSRETVVGASFEQDRVTSKAEQFARDIEAKGLQILKLVGLFMGLTPEQVDSPEFLSPVVNTRVGIDLEKETDLLSLENDAANGVISKKRVFAEKVARGYFRTEIDWDKEQAQIDKEAEREARRPVADTGFQVGTGGFGKQGGEKSAQQRNKPTKDPGKGPAGGTAGKPSV